MAGDTINFFTGSTRTRIQIDMNHPHMMYLRQLFKEILSDYEWDKRLHKLQLMNRYYCYNRSTGEFLIPAVYTDYIVRNMEAIGAHINVVEEDLVKGRTIHLKMKPSFTPRPNQVEAIDYLASDDPSCKRKGLSLMTGGGKTAVTIAAIVKRKKAAMIIAQGLMEQWYQEIMKFTTAKPDDVVIVQGIQSLLKLIEEDKKPSIIIFSTSTLRRYVNREENYQDLPSYEKFIKYFGIDTKVIDECHLCFHTGTFVDLHSNIQNNVYLTATFTSTNQQTRKIFNRIYPVNMRFGANVRDRYIDIYSYSYSYSVPPKCYTRLRGYFHVGYEKYFLKRPSKLMWFFESVLVPLINSHYDNRCAPGQRMMILFSTINLIMEAKRYLTLKYPNRKVGVYIGESDDMEYDKYEIILSNVKKAGTGTDIKQLYVVLNTISFSSPTLTEQVLGRLRKLPDGTTPHYLELVNIQCEAHIKHRIYRQEIQKRLSRSYKEIFLPT